jgi:hypothetical protein
MQGLHLSQHKKCGGLKNTYAFTHSPYTSQIGHSVGNNPILKLFVHGFMGYALQDLFWGLGHFVIYSRHLYKLLAIQLHNV